MIAPYHTARLRCRADRHFKARFPRCPPVALMCDAHPDGPLAGSASTPSPSRGSSCPGAQTIPANKTKCSRPGRRRSRNCRPDPGVGPHAHPASRHAGLCPTSSCPYPCSPSNVRLGCLSLRRRAEPRRRRACSGRVSHPSARWNSCLPLFPRSPSRGRRPRALLRPYPPPSCGACPGRAGPGCGLLPRAAAARWGGRKVLRWGALNFRSARSRQGGAAPAGGKLEFKCAEGLSSPETSRRCPHIAPATRRDGVSQGSAGRSESP
jgi:hypothetical protein